MNDHRQRHVEYELLRHGLSWVIWVLLFPSFNSAGVGEPVDSTPTNYFRKTKPHQWRGFVSGVDGWMILELRVLATPPKTLKNYIIRGAWKFWGTSLNS